MRSPVTLKFCKLIATATSFMYILYMVATATILPDSLYVVAIEIRPTGSQVYACQP
jgi:hypothetical protein